MGAISSCPLHTGAVLAGRYRLAAEVSRRTAAAGSTDTPGSAAITVWHGHDELLARPVAIKVHSPGGAPARGFLDTAATAGRLSHPGLARVYDAADNGECAYVVSEWVDGTTLGEALVDGPLDPGEATRLLRGAADAIAAAHRLGVVHGRLHPDNLLLTRGGTKITDIAVHAQGAAPADDVHALGALLYAALTARWPLRAASTLPPAPRENGRRAVSAA